MRVFEVQKDGKQYCAIQIIEDRRVKTTLSTPSLWRMKEVLLRTNYGFKIASNINKGRGIWVITMEETSP